MERLDAALMHVLKNPQSLEGMTPVMYLSDEVWSTMWDTKELGVSNMKREIERGGGGGRLSQSQGSRPKKKHTLLVDRMLDRGGKKYREKTNAV